MIWYVINNIPNLIKMEKLSIGQAAKEVIEIPTSIAPPEPESGFPWCGTGIAVVVVVVAVGLYKKLKK